MDKLDPYIAIITPYALRLSFIEFIILGVVLLLFILFFTLALLVRGIKILALPISFLSFAILAAAPLILELAMTRVIYPAKLEMETDKKLTFSDTYFVSGLLTNESKRRFKGCDITFSLLRQASDPLKRFQYSIKPLKVQRKRINQTLAPKESVAFQQAIDGVSYSFPVESKIKAACF